MAQYPEIRQAFSQQLAAELVQLSEQLSYEQERQAILRGKLGLLEWLGEGTVILNNIQQLPPELVPQIAKLLQKNTCTPVGEDPRKSSVSRAWTIMISEKMLPDIERRAGHSIKVPPLRVRFADIAAHVE